MFRRSYEGAEVESTDGAVYWATLSGKFTVAASDAILHDLQAATASDDFAVIYVISPGFDGYEREVRNTAKDRLIGQATAVVTTNPALRMVVSAVGLASAPFGRRMKGFDDRESAERWCRSHIGTPEA